MGRFGNRLLVAGDPDLHLTFRAGEVVRLWLTNTANTRVFNVACRRPDEAGRRGQRSGRV
jgi:FtsP/CotA-like multicopper oxidase with cupredoxin domain